MTKEHYRIRRLVVIAMLVAIVLLLSFTPLGYLTIGVCSITLVQIPVLIAAAMEGIVPGLGVALAFGLTSWYKAFAAASLLDPLFQNPLIAILPRLLIAPAAYFATAGMRKLFPDKRKLAYGVGAAAGSLANTVFTILALTLAVRIDPGLIGLQTEAVSGTVAVLWGLVLTNGLPECAASVVVVAAVAMGLEKAGGGVGRK